MGAGHSVTVLYELIPAGMPLGIPSVDPLKYQTMRPDASRAAANEAMTVKVRYKAPAGRTSSLMEVPVINRIEPNEALGFATAVAEFGMLQRDTDYKGAASFSHAADQARTFKGADPHGHRDEFIRLISAAEGVTRVKTSAPRQ
jgi:Ca-activated chloride channel family protein